MTEEEKRERRKQYREKNKERIREQNRKYMKEYYAKNKEKIKAYQQSYYAENTEILKSKSTQWKKENKEKADAYNKKYRAEHRKEHTEYIARRRKEDPTYKLICATRNLLNNAFNKRTKIRKTKQAEEILGCSIEFFIEHLKSQFKEGMTIENHGEWHIDHIVPLSTATSEDEVIKLNHYTNLQPLWAKENISKGKRTS